MGAPRGINLATGVASSRHDSVLRLADVGWGEGKKGTELHARPLLLQAIHAIPIGTWHRADPLELAIPMAVPCEVIHGTKSSPARGHHRRFFEL